MPFLRQAVSLLGLTTFAALGLAAGPRAAHAQAYNFITFNYPNATSTFARGLNNNGQIVGRYDTNGGAVSSGFSVNVGTLPSAGFTSYSTGDAFTEFGAINNAGQIAGDYVRNSDSTNPGFLLSGSTRTDFNPGAAFTIPAGISTGGAVSGTAINANGIAQGFVRASGGGITFFNNPRASAQGTFGTGNNDAGTTVGFYINSGGFFTAFRNLNGVSTDLSLSATFSTVANEINNAGDIVGSYQTPGTTAFNPSQGFLLTAAGTLITLNVPGAASTEIFGINDSRQVVGNYTDSAGNVRGFFASPPAAVPEPSGWVALGLGAVALSALTLKARRRSV